jgi:hypothetical protein
MNICRHKVVADIRLKREISNYDLLILLILNSLDYFQSDVHFSYAWSLYRTLKCRLCTCVDHIRNCASVSSFCAFINPKTQ